MRQMLSKHFSYSELTKTSTGLRNVPNDSQLANLYLLALSLESIRAAVGNRPIVVTSAFRSPAVNRQSGGVPNSAHLSGLAADIYCPGISSLQLIAAAKSSLWRFDQLILEGDIVHVGLAIQPKTHAKQVSILGGRGQVLSRRASPRRPGHWEYVPLAI